MSTLTIIMKFFSFIVNVNNKIYIIFFRVRKGINKNIQALEAEVYYGNLFLFDIFQK